MKDSIKMNQKIQADSLVDDVKILLSKITSSSGKLTKKISLDDGKLFKTPAANMISGNVETVETDLKALGDVMQALGHNQAIVHGTCGQDNARIVAKKQFNGQPGAITRTKDFFSYPPGPALVMIDYDPDDGQPVLSHADVAAAIDGVCPGFSGIQKLLTRSMSSCIYKDDGTELSG